MKLIYPFSRGEKTGGEIPALDQVGGKGYSLIYMAQKNLPVPPGFVLSVAFFQPWLERVWDSLEWGLALNSPPETWEKYIQDVERLCHQLELDGQHRYLLDQEIEKLENGSQPTTYAVRSSSPQEDLEGASFAGAYVTSLGVPKGDLEEAICRSFASAFSPRVLLYKRERGFDIQKPTIAVLVQRQVPSDQAGVCFSLNPSNNCYDQAVVNANFGLGETVVSGEVSPDEFIIDKLSRTILERKRGEKETSIWLYPGGGTYHQPHPSREELCLSNEQVLEIVDLTAQVEEAYHNPIDIEWGISEGNLFLFQARPITAYFPLPPALRTEPREQKYLYGDLTLLKWGMPRPFSPLGMDMIRMGNLEMIRKTLSQSMTPDGLSQLRPTYWGRTYVNLAVSIKVQGADRVIGEVRSFDSATADILEATDLNEYIPPQAPPELRFVLLKMIRTNLGTGWNILKAMLNPSRHQERYLRAEAQLCRDLDALEKERNNLSLTECTHKGFEMMFQYLDAFFPAIALAELARSRINKQFQDEDESTREQIAYLQRALPNNVTIEMGLAMYRLACTPAIRDCPSGEEFAARLQEGSFSPQFHEAWEEFMNEYGFRGPMEMDPAAPRFKDQPEKFFDQLKSMSERADDSHNPRAVFERAKARREAAYQELHQAAQSQGTRQANGFDKNYHLLMTFGGYREKPKYFMVWITDQVRRKILELAQKLVAVGRLDQPQDAFSLTYSQLEQSLEHQGLDLRPLIEENSHYLRKLKDVRQFPRLIDSRGLILRSPPRETGEGELAGQPISPGVVRGPVKVLHRPDEKPILPGDILVTRSTDPGWTPLFLNAGGIVLEVGGLLQHGALVAREYGKPCVAGIEGATDILQDGQIVELDGINGSLHLLEA